MFFDKVPFIYGSGVIPATLLCLKRDTKYSSKRVFAGDNFETFVKQNNESLKTKVEANLNFEKVFLSLQSNRRI
ncbi:MAG: hypothetical protein CM15mP58_12880 [Burkholderiaceae bacterium]|nr:MAG: hypothetical protein CM15mP58_12880 [Burkholderiaceae bacterium]